MRDGGSAGTRWSALLALTALVAAAGQDQVRAEPTVAERGALCDLSRFLRPKTWQDQGVQPCRNDIDTCRVPAVYCSNGHIERLLVAPPLVPLFKIPWMCVCDGREARTECCRDRR